MASRPPLVLLAALALLLPACGGSKAKDIAFVSSRDDVYAIYVMSKDGDGVRRLTEEEAPTSETSSGLFFEIEPAWSPDGTKVAFASRREGNLDIYVTDADGKGTRRLTAAEADESRPAWSPDGKQIVYQRGDPADLWVMDADGRRARLLVEYATGEHDPDWSPDGEWIAYELRRAGTPLAEIWLVRPNGKDGRHVETVDGQSSAPAWSPDGKRLAFAGNIGRTNYDIYTVGVDGKGMRRVTSSPLDEFEPAYSPDGKSIVFDRGGAIVVSDADGEVHELTEAETNDGSPSWRPQTVEQSSR